ncbi:RluA family pseudouridine synthase [Desulfurobacterium sp.]
MEVKVTNEHNKKRLDVFLSNIADISRNQAKLLIEDGEVSINGKIIKKPSHKVKEGDIVSFEIPEPVPLNVEPENIPVEIVYEDKDVVVLNKPAGMVVHPAPGHYTGTLVNALLYHCKDLQGINGTIRPGIVHRIDKDTAGLLVVAKNDTAQNSLIEQFKKRSVGRFYRAFVHGTVKKDKERIVLPIGRDKFNRKKFSPNTTSPKEAITNYQVINRFEKLNFTDIRCKLETGRTHQIRVHMSYLGHPLLGDEIYGFKLSRIKDETLRKLIKEMNMHALCACYLAFDHPSTKKRMEFEIDLPEGMRKILDYAEKQR